MIDRLGNELKTGDKVLAVTRAGHLEEAIVITIDYAGVNYRVADVKYTSGRIGKNKFFYHLVKII